MTKSAKHKIDNKSLQKSTRRIVDIQTDPSNLDQSRLRLAYNNYQTNSTDMFELPEDLTQRDEVDYLDFVRRLENMQKSPALNDHEEA